MRSEPVWEIDNACDSSPEPHPPTHPLTTTTTPHQPSRTCQSLLSHCGSGGGEFNLACAVLLRTRSSADAVFFAYRDNLSSWCSSNQDGLITTLLLSSACGTEVLRCFPKNGPRYRDPTSMRFLASPGSCPFRRHFSFCYARTNCGLRWSAPSVSNITCSNVCPQSLDCTRNLLGSDPDDNSCERTSILIQLRSS